MHDALNFYKSRRPDYNELQNKREEVRRKGFLYSLLAELSRRCNNGAAEIVLDIGGGSGTNLILLRNLLDVRSGVLIDLCPRPLDSRHTNSVCADAAYLPIKPGSANLILLVEVIEHLLNPDKALRSIHGLLRDDGLLVLSTPNLACLFNRIMLFGGYQPLFTEVSTTQVFGRPGSEVVGHLRLFTYRALREFLEYHGFKIEKMFTVPLFRRGAFGAVMALLERFCIALSPSLGSRIIVILQKEEQSGKIQSVGQLREGIAP